MYIVSPIPNQTEWLYHQQGLKKKKGSEIQCQKKKES